MFEGSTRKKQKFKNYLLKEIARVGIVSDIPTTSFNNINAYAHISYE